MSPDRWAGRTVFVTGGLGFIGSHFVEELLARDARVVCLYRTPREEMLAQLPRGDNLRLLQLDLLDHGEVRAACRYASPNVDAIIHCAALDGNTEFKLNHSAEILDTNLRITSNVLNCAREYGVPDVALLSSAEVYQGETTGAIHEDDDYRRHMRYSTNGYALSKTFVEVLAELHRAQYGMNILVPRPTNVYGPRDGFDGTSGRVIPTMLRRIAAGEEVVIWGDGSQTRTFVHVADLVRATLRMMEQRRYATMNVGTDEPVSVLELAATLFAVMDRPERIRLDPSKPTGASSRLLDVRRMAEITSFTPRPLRVGLRQTAEWFLAQEPVLV
ncbi:MULTISPECIES: SDR family NAD(P)-dependent oxidoreductase [unclassified Streptomyces]|uniref:NAD-dependent epimerase/dehydratase family protein n=1 Tax=unclassified Streptomyces TaxID=2593676 RepID=UPI0033CDF366